MENFVYQNKTKIIFGRETEIKAGSEAKFYGKKVLLHYGGGSIKRSGLYSRVKTSLEKEGLKVFELGGVKPNPRLSLVKEGIKLCLAEKIDLILAVGGGSVIDSAKGIGIGTKYKGDVWDFYTGKATPEAMLPIGVVLTIPAAGSETSGGSVVTKEDDKHKNVAFAECMRPEFAILNPELNFTLSNYQTACGICDMFSHILERYFTKTKNVELTDRLCEGAMKTIISNAYKVMKNPKDYDSRAELLWSSTIAHNDILGTGRVGDWSSHGLEHELSALTDIAHGAGLSIIFPAWMKYVYKTDIKRFKQFSIRVFGNDEKTWSDDELALMGVNAMENFFSNLGLPTRLSEVNFDPNKIEVMVNRLTDSGKNTIGSFKELNSNDIKSIYQLAM